MALRVCVQLGDLNSGLVKAKEVDGATAIFLHFLVADACGRSPMTMHVPCALAQQRRSMCEVYLRLDDTGLKSR